MNTTTKYVIYYRVSTKRQGESGLGLDAQQRDVNIFLESYAKDYEVLGTFTDIASGSNDKREGFVEALALAKRYKAELLISKLDRISRKVSTIALMMEQVVIRVASMPFADNFQLHIYAALAEQEREFISKRTKDALAAAKRKGVLLGSANPLWQEKNKDMLNKMNHRKNTKAREHAEKYRKEIELLVSFNLSLDKIATKMKELNLTTSKGCYYTAASVSNLLGYLDIVRNSIN
jgi:DNA invertase Pin-like site-specific DNA recombinase